MSEDEFITQKRSISNFDKLIISELQEADLEIIQGDHEALIIEGLADILERITTTIEGSTLLIKTEGPFLKKLRDSIRTSIDRNTTKYTLYVKNLVSLEIKGVIRTKCNGLTTPSLTLINKGVGRIIFRNLHTDNLGVNLADVGDIKMEGKATEQYVTIRGTARYDASKLESSSAQIRLKGIGDAIVWVKKDLQVNITGIGSVSYYGSPSVQSKGSLLANVTKLGEK